MIPSFFKVEIFAIHTKYSESVTNGLILKILIPDGFPDIQENQWKNTYIIYFSKLIFFLSYDMIFIVKTCFISKNPSILLALCYAGQSCITPQNSSSQEDYERDQNTGSSQKIPYIVRYIPCTTGKKLHNICSM